MKLLIPCLLALPAIASPASAQQATRSWVEITPEGVFVREELVPTALSLSHSTTAASQSMSAAQLRWTYPNPVTAPWITHSVSVGNIGALAWLGQLANGQRLSLVATTDDFGSPPKLIYERLFNGSTVVVKAADKSPAAVVSQVKTSAQLYRLRYFTGFSTTPKFTITQPDEFEVSISDDGTRFTAGYTNGAGQAQVDVYDTTSVTPTVPIRTLTASPVVIFKHHAISGDGSTVLLASGVENYVFDVGSGNEIFSDSSTVSHDAHVISYDGSAWGRGGFDIRAWVHDGSTYNEVLTFDEDVFGLTVATACGISSDGSTFAAAASDGFAENEFRLYVWDLTVTGSTLLWAYSHTGSGSLTDLPSAVSLSDDGRWIAIGSWGSEFGGHAEAMLFDRDAGNVPVEELDTPGSVFDVDLSGDGQFWVVGTKSVHANTTGNGGEGYSLDRGDQGHRLVGTPSIGRSIDLETYGTSGDVAVQVLATSLLAVPLPLAGFTGAIEIAPTTIFGPVFVVGTIGGSGVVANTLALPGDVNLVGKTIFSQSMRFGSNALENHLRISITP